jgi:hypothetical protein
MERQEHLSGIGCVRYHVIPLHAGTLRYGETNMTLDEEMQIIEKWVKRGIVIIVVMVLGAFGFMAGA